MTPPAKRRVYPPNPALFPNTPPGLPAASTPPLSSDAPPSVIVDVEALHHQKISQGPPLPSSTPPSPPLQNAFDSRRYGARDRPTVTENDLVLQIETLKGLNRPCYELIKRCELRINLAEKKSPDRVAMLPLIIDAHRDLQDAFRLANEYTLGDSVKNQWLGQISTAQEALKTLAELNKFILPELPPSPPLAAPAPLPPKTEKTSKPVPQSPLIMVKRVAAGIFAVLALAFSVGVAIKQYLIKNK